MLYKKYKGKILAPSNTLSYLSARGCFRYSLLYFKKNTLGMSLAQAV